VLQPGEWLIGHAFARPGIQRAHPGILHDVLGEAPVAADALGDIGVKRSYGLPV